MTHEIRIFPALVLDATELTIRCVTCDFEIEKIAEQEYPEGIPVSALQLPIAHHVLGSPPVSAVAAP